MRDNVVSGNFNEQQEAIERFRQNFEPWVEAQKLMAKARKATYDAHLAEGFTEAQALEIVKVMNL